MKFIILFILLFMYIPVFTQEAQTENAEAQQQQQTTAQTQAEPQRGQVFSVEPVQEAEIAPVQTTPQAVQQQPANQQPTNQQSTNQQSTNQQAPANQQQPNVQQPSPQTSTRRSADPLQNYRIGRDLEARNRFEEANSYYNEAIRLCLDLINRNSTNMDAYTILTWSLLRQRRYTEAVSWGDRALRINPNDFRIVETMGEAYFFLNDYEHSLIMLQRYAASVPRGDRASSAYFFMGEIYRNRRKYLHADIAYTTAVTLEGNIALWWFRLGSVREAAGDYAPAVEAYEKAISLNPNYREASDALDRAKKLVASSR